MSKKILFFLLLPLSSFSQNLVPNPSFEDTVMCPSGSGLVEYCANWKIFRDSPDYFQECASLSTLSVPYNFEKLEVNGKIASQGILITAEGETHDLLALINQLQNEVAELKQQVNVLTKN